MSSADVTRVIAADSVIRLIKHEFAGVFIRHRDEFELQDGVGRILAALAARGGEGFKLEREATLDASARVDFLLELHGIRVAVEVKTAGSSTSVASQLLRYARFASVDGIVLVTTRAVHLTIKPQLAGKPARVIWLSAAGL